MIWVYGIYIAVKAYNGEDVKAPVIGDYASRYSGYAAQNVNWKIKAQRN